MRVHTKTKETCTLKATWRGMGANPHANGGLLLKALELPSFQDTRSNSKKTASARLRAPPFSAVTCATCSG